MKNRATEKSNVVQLVGVALMAVTLVACGGQEPSTAGASSAVVAGSAHQLPPPPQEALDACATLERGAECAVTHEGRQLRGKCLNDPEDRGPLACVPPPPREAVAACEGLQPGDSCSFTLDGARLDGSCRPGPADQQQDPPPLACAP